MVFVGIVCAGYTTATTTSDVAFIVAQGESVDALFIEEAYIGVAPHIWWRLATEDGRVGWYFVFSPGPSSSSLRTIPASETARAAQTATPPTITPAGS